MLFLIGTMEDTQRSQPISTENQRIAEQRVCNIKKMSKAMGDNGRPPVITGETSFIRIRKLAEEKPNLVFTSLSHRIDLSLLTASFRQVRKSESSGVDGVTVKEYEQNLDENLYNLHQRLRRGQYAATPVKRIRIPKENGKMRPTGIPALEDKIVQKAVETMLYVVYDGDFYDFSHGFRKDHSQHMAIQELREQCLKLNINWIVDADISGFFDNISHELPKEVIRQRVNDGGILRLIGKWLNAGVMEEGKLSRSESGTPQGGVISPLLANIFLHTVPDDWFVKEVKPRMKGRCFMIRWADDFIIGFEVKSDADRVMDVLPKRFGKNGISLNMEKTKLIPFMKPRAKYIPETFDFLGFTVYWEKSWKGKWVIKKRTAKKRLKRFKNELWEWFKKVRHNPVREQYEKLCVKLKGWYQYYGLRGNYKSLESVYEYAQRAWRYWLNRRSQKGLISWEKFKEMLENILPLPKPRIVHNI